MDAGINVSGSSQRLYGPRIGVAVLAGAIGLPATAYIPSLLAKVECPATTIFIGTEARTVERVVCLMLGPFLFFAVLGLKAYARYLDSVRQRNLASNRPARSVPYESHGRSLAGWAVMAASAGLYMIGLSGDRVDCLTTQGVGRQHLAPPHLQMLSWSQVATLTTRCWWQNGNKSQSAQWRQEYSFITASGEKVSLGDQPDLSPADFDRLARILHGHPVMFDDSERADGCPFRDFQAHLQHPYDVHMVDAYHYRPIQ